PDTARVQLVSELLPVLHGAEDVQDTAIIGYIVAHVVSRGLKNRAQPDTAYSQVCEVIHAVYYSAQVAYTVAVRVLEAARIYLVENALLPPMPVKLHYTSPRSKRISSAREADS